jgi:hypothetical protein
MSSFTMTIGHRRLSWVVLGMLALILLISGCQPQAAPSGGAPNFFQFDPAEPWNGTWNASNNGLWTQMHIHFFTHQGQTYGSMRVAKNLEIRHINLVDIAPGYGSITFATDWEPPGGNRRAGRSVHRPGGR